MTAIKAQITKDKESKATIYSFQANGEQFAAYLVPPITNPTLHIQHNETTLGTIMWKIDKNRKFQYTVNTKTEPLTITVWLDLDGKPRSNRKSIGIEVNGEPVQHTLADPQLILEKKLESSSLILLGFIFMIIPFGPFEQPMKSIDLSYIYFIPFLIGIILAIKHKSYTLFAIFSNIYLLILEIIHILDLGTFSNSFIAMWFSIRIGILFALCYTFKEERELKKASNA